MHLGLDVWAKPLEQLRLLRFQLLNWHMCDQRGQGHHVHILEAIHPKMQQSSLSFQEDGVNPAVRTKNARKSQNAAIVSSQEGRFDRKELEEIHGLFASATWIGVSHNWPQLTLTKIRQMTNCFFVVHSDSILDSTLLYSISFQIQIHNFKVSLVLTGGNQTKKNFKYQLPASTTFSPM